MHFTKIQPQWLQRGKQEANEMHLPGGRGGVVRRDPVHIAAEHALAVRCLQVLRM